MNKKLLSLLVALVAMFGCLGSAEAQTTYTGAKFEVGKLYYVYNVQYKTFISGQKSASSNIADAIIFKAAKNDNHTYLCKLEDESAVLNPYSAGISTLPNVNVGGLGGTLSIREKSSKNNDYLYYISYSFKVIFSVSYANLGQSDATTLNKADNKTGDAYTWKFIPVDDANLKIKAGCYGTFVAPFDVTLPDGVVAYSAGGISNNEVPITQLTLSNNVLPAGNPVIVKHSSGTEVDNTYYGPFTTTDEVTNNGLRGFYKKDIDITKGNYILQNQGDGQKFYVVGDTPFKSSKNRCCLPAASSEPAKVLNLKFVENEETSVENVTIGASVVGYYSANGAKLSAPKAGVNIVKMSDGTVKKVLVK